MNLYEVNGFMVVEIEVLSQCMKQTAVNVGIVLRVVVISIAPTMRLTKVVMLKGYQTLTQ